MIEYTLIGLVCSFISMIVFELVIGVNHKDQTDVIMAGFMCLILGMGWPVTIIGLIIFGVYYVMLKAAHYCADIVGKMK